VQLFKYCRQEHLRSMLERGEARVGTLFDWRDNARAYGEMSGDEAEGVLKHPGALVFHEADARALLAAGDVYAFSTSAAYSEDAHRKWLEAEGYDACYRILSAKLFFRALSAALKDADYQFFAPVQYLDPRAPPRAHEIPGRFHPALLKRSTGYTGQAEVRALWMPREPQKEIKPVRVERSRAGGYCESYRIIAPA
jgi:hypothetical protein